MFPAYYGFIGGGSPAPSPITLGNVTSTQNTSALLTFAHNSDGDFLVVVIDSWAQLATAVTYNGVSMTLTAGTQGLSGNRRGNMWHLSNPASGSNNVVVTLPASNQLIATALSLNDVNATPIQDGAGAISGTVTVDTLENGFVIGSDAFASADDVAEQPPSTEVVYTKYGSIGASVVWQASTADGNQSCVWTGTPRWSMAASYAPA